jgi:invasion protein IalB
MTLATVQPAFAQAEKAMALPGGASSLQENHGDWTVSCRVAEARKSCMVLQALGRSTGETVLSLELVPLSETQAEGILLSPFGLKLADGVKLAVDGTPFANPFPFMTCVEAGCIVPVALKANELGRLTSGKEMLVSAANASSGAAVELKLSLKGFKTAFNRARELLAVRN